VEREARGDQWATDWGLWLLFGVGVLGLALLLLFGFAGLAASAEPHSHLDLSQLAHVIGAAILTALVAFLAILRAVVVARLRRRGEAPRAGEVAVRVVAAFGFLILLSAGVSIAVGLIAVVWAAPLAALLLFGLIRLTEARLGLPSSGTNVGLMASRLMTVVGIVLLTLLAAGILFAVSCPAVAPLVIR
jgi:hypothetical protein